MCADTHNFRRNPIFPITGLGFQFKLRLFGDGSLSQGGGGATATFRLRHGSSSVIHCWENSQWTVQQQSSHSLSSNEDILKGMSSSHLGFRGSVSVSAIGQEVLSTSLCLSTDRPSYSSQWSSTAVQISTCAYISLPPSKNVNYPSEWTVISSFREVFIKNGNN